MREIKFRVWNKLYKEMSLVGEINFQQKKLAFLTDMEGIRIRSLGEKSLEDYPLMQYTGLKDKNGVEIYEGDVVVKDGEHFYHIGQIADNGYGVWCILDEHGNYNNDWAYDNKGNDYKVIGNIYENPELLKE